MTAGAEPPGPPGAPGERLHHPVVRPYVLTLGRTRVDGLDLAIEDPILARIPPSRVDASASPEVRAIVAVCQDALSLAEVSAHVGVPIGVARVLVADLSAQGLVAVRPSRPTGAQTDVKLLERLLDGIRAL